MRGPKGISVFIVREETAEEVLETRVSAIVRAWSVEVQPVHKDMDGFQKMGYKASGMMNVMI
jgi:hypothetical protein